MAATSGSVGERTEHDKYGSWSYSERQSFGQNKRATSRCPSNERYSANGAIKCAPEISL